MGDHYQTLGLQPNASKSDIKNAYFRLAHRYHPDHHAKADAADRAATAAAFRRTKDAYDVLYDDSRRAVYDRTIHSSSSASRGSYGGGDSSRWSGFSTEEFETWKKKWDADWEKWEAEKKKRNAEWEDWKKKWKEQQDNWEIELESRWKEIARQHGDFATSFSEEWESEWASLWEQVVQTRPLRGTTMGTDWNKEIGALWKRVELKRQGQYGGSAFWRWSCQGRYSNSTSHGHSGTSSSTGSNGHDHRGSRGRPPPRMPRPIAGGIALSMCCVVVFGGSALLWSTYNKRSAKNQRESSMTRK